MRINELDIFLFVMIVMAVVVFANTSIISYSNLSDSGEDGKVYWTLCLILGLLCFTVSAGLLIYLYFNLGVN